ncbi:phage holin family protein [Flavobacterium sp.]|uniref:phage holin family protein n=1 Tax=Flavobacterium sp. TaxID=239 RepID=UPI0011FEE601|nr:phage holin family protein [Flavobacterium sp.]RZJ71363.1 MAG: phage holin family protein [Flavobacterium sp.]
MNVILRLIATALLVMLLSYFLPGVGVDGFFSAMVVAIVLGLLNLFVKPILVLFTLPVTILTFGLFLLVINAVVIMMVDYFVDGFRVTSFLTAVLFSLILSVVQSLIFSSGKD